MHKVILNDVIDIISGGTPKTDIEKYWNGEIGWLSVVDFNNDNRYVYSSEKSITPEGMNNSSTKLLNIGDVIISARGTVGALAQIGKPMCFNQSCFGLRGKQGIITNDYLYYALKNYISNMRKRTQGSVFETINLLSFKLMDITIHDKVEEQSKISYILGLLDNKIELNNKINNELEQMAKTLYDYWFVQFDFPDEKGRPYKSANGKMVYNEVLKREIPLGWEVKPLKRLIKHINTGLNPRDNFTLGNGNIKYITVKNITENNLLDFKNCDVIDEVARDKVHNRSDIKVGDILFASITPLGRCYLIENEPNDWDINESVFSIRADITQISSEYLLMCLTSEYFIKKASNSSTGSIFTGIRIKSLEDMPTIVPPQNIIKQFTAQLKLLLKKKNICFKENINLEEIRDFLLPLLMNGQVTVSSEH